MTELEQAAMEYGAALAALSSATDCYAQSDLLHAMEFGMMDARANLLKAAYVFYNNRYDGAE